MIDRYSRQTLFRGIGKKGQQKLGASSVVIIGCGALGTVTATSLVSAGVGKVKIIDRDLIEYHNLQRQILFTEEDVENELPKAVAAERHLKKVNSSVEVEGVVADVHYGNIEKLVAGADLILDGLDNPETRFLVNDVSLKHRIPWIYGGAIVTYGMTMNIIPRETPCFRCVFHAPPPKGMIPTCDTAGVIGPAPMLIASLQSTEALKILVGAKEVNRDVITVDVWQGTFDRFRPDFRPDCPACRGDYEFLKTEFGIRTTVLCGQYSVQVHDPKVEKLSLKTLARYLEPLGEVNNKKILLDFKTDGKEMVIFPDGRLILKNSFDEPLARKLYFKFVAAGDKEFSGSKRE
jgi:molybdopterin/thiamine biosynthesis adenylyltransferase